MKYYRLNLLKNNDRFRSLGRLTNEYLVDMASRIEEECLDYRRQGLIQWAGGETDIDYRLGSDWIGSRAWASEQVADSLASCCEFKRPSLSIAVTTNPHWPEMEERLYLVQNASYQPVVIAREFKAHMSRIMKAIPLVDNPSITICHLLTFVAVTTWARYFTKLRLTNSKREAYHMPIKF